MRSPRLLFSVCVTLLLSAPALCESRSLRECAGEDDPDFRRARAEWYMDTFGHRGVLDPERMLAITRETHETRLLERRRPAAFEGRSFRFLGPSNGAGRTPAIEPHPTDPNIVYAGAAGGGCWKSTDGGDSWRSLTDDLPNLSVGAVAIAPGNPSVVYLGTGEGGYAGDFIPGIGLLRSTNGGETWTLPDSVVSPMIYKLSVDPRNADTVVLFAYIGAQRSTDGGRTWRRTSDLAWGDAVDLVRDPTNPDLLHGTFWTTTGSNAGRYARSTDAGSTWTEVRTGLPNDPKSRMSLAISADGRTLYTMIAGSGSVSQVGLYRSTNGGTNWSQAALQDPSVSRVPDILSGQGTYDNCVAVDPDDARVVVIGGGGAGTYRSTDGGQSVGSVGRPDGMHVDVHQLVFKKYGSTKLLWNANDGGLWLSTDGGVRWRGRNQGLATRQYYALSVDPTRGDVYYAGSQDNGTDRRGNDSTEFVHALGGDGFETAVDPSSPATAYASGQYASIYRSRGDGSLTSFSYVAQSFAGRAYSSSGGDGVKPFFSKILLDPEDPRVVYTGTWRVWRSEDRGESWAPLDSRAFAPDASIRSLAIARSRPSRLLVAQRFQLFLSDDRGASFSLLGFGSATTIYSVEIDPNDPDTFYVAAAATTPTRAGMLYKSTNRGVSFSRVGNGLPDVASWVVRVDPSDSRVVYAGTLVGLYRSLDGGATFSRFGEGLPAVAVLDVRLSPDGARLSLATHGRGLWESVAPAANRGPAVSIVDPAGPVSIRPGDAVFFRGAAIDPDGDAVAALRWDFGDGSVAVGEAPAPITFRTPGVYTVTLVAEDARGGRGAALVTVTVRPPNDACDDALDVALLPGQKVTLRTGNGGALELDAADPPTCSQPEISNSVWFRFTPPAGGTLAIDSYGSLGDTVLALFQGTCDSPGVTLTCNDDASDVSGGPSRLVTQTVEAGKTYRLLAATWADRAEGYRGPVDSLRVNATFTPTAAGPSPGTSVVLPVALDAFGKNGARFVSDLSLLNRGSARLTAALTWGGALTTGSTVTTTSVNLGPGEQLRAEDALEELRRLGLAIPKTTEAASQVGSLTALVTQGAPESLVIASRTASPNPVAAVGGSFGLFSAGTPFADAADAEAVYVYGLRQTERDRANLALVHVRTPLPAEQAGASITLNVEVFDGSGAAAPQSPITVRLSPGQWTQIGEVLAQAGLSAGDGYARVTRTEGQGRFLAYGVVNDQRTADGSLVPMVRSGALTAGKELLVPIVLQARGLASSFFTSELLLANRSSSAGSAVLRYVPSPLLGGLGGGSVSVPLGAGSQKVIEDVVAFLRANGLAIPTQSPQGGALFVTFQGFAASDDVYAGVRTATPNPDAFQGGSFGVFSPAVGRDEMATTSAVVPALRQDELARSNLAVVNGGASPITLSVALRSSDGTAVGSVLTRTLQQGEWYQWSNVFAQAGAGEGEGWAQVTRSAGDAPWLVYGVLNDAKTSDGSVVNMVR